MRPDLAALVGSRICHDLISPIGAIGNGVELLSLTDGDTGAEMNLISESVENANARIRFFRMAFGAANPEQMIGRSDIISILDATAKGGRFTYAWHPQGDQPRQIVRCAFLIFQCLESALPMGGKIAVHQSDEAWTISAEGRRLNIDEALWESLTEAETSFHHSAAQVQFALLPDVLREMGRRLKLDFKSERLVARF